MLSNRQHTRKYQIIILIGLILQLEANVVRNDEEKRVIKRGYDSSGNDYGPAVHITSSVLQLEKSPTIEMSGLHYEIPIDDNPWKPSGITPGYEVWAVNTESDLQHFQPITHSAGVYLPHAESVFSSDSHHQPPRSHPVSVLHTQITSSGHDGTIQLSDNVDFNNVADAKSKHYTPSYG